MASIRAYRLAVQITSLIIIYGTLIGRAATELILPILVPYPQYATVVSALDAFQTITTSGAFPRVPLAVIFGTAIVLGRAFCGRVCPVGFVQDLFVPIARRFGSKISKEQNKSLYYTGLFFLSLFLILIASIGAEVAAGVKSLEELSRSLRAPYTVIDPANTAISIAIKASFRDSRTAYKKLAIIRIFVFALFLYLLVRVPRGRCRRFCPLGLLMSLVSKYSLVVVKIDPLRCTQCGKCVRACPMGVDLLDYKYTVRDPLCILCLDCVDACPEGAIKVAIERGYAESYLPAYSPVFAPDLSLPSPSLSRRKLIDELAGYISS